MLNYFENTYIKNSKLPDEWKSQSALDELHEFLQANWEQRAIFYEDGILNSQQQFLEFKGQKSIRTNDYVGTIVFKGQQLNIFPKMFKVDKDDNSTDDLVLSDLIRNLIIWINYINKIDYPYIKISSDFECTDNLQELFISLYIRYVKSALDRGLFFKYENINEDVTSIKGTPNIIDYYSKKYSTGKIDKFNCNFSTFEFDNLLNRIIKFTCKKLYNVTSLKNQKLLKYILNKLGEVSDVRCTPMDCDKIILSKMHDKYRIVLSMSKMFLLNKLSSYNIDVNESFCFLFPTDLLFEGFIGGYIKSLLKSDAKVTLQASDVPLFENIVMGDKEFGQAFLMKHDILITHKTKGLFILDTKYKEISRFEGNVNLKQDLLEMCSQSDFYQVSAYASNRGLNDVYLLYPQYRYEELEPEHIVFKQRVHHENNTYIINVHALRIPFVFEDESDISLQKLKDALLKIL